MSDDPKIERQRDLCEMEGYLRHLSDDALRKLVLLLRHREHEIDKYWAEVFGSEESQ